MKDTAEVRWSYAHSFAENKEDQQCRDHFPQLATTSGAELDVVSSCFSIAVREARETKVDEGIRNKKGKNEAAEKLRTKTCCVLPLF